MRSLEGSTVNNERVVMLFKEAVELSNELEQMRMQDEDVDQSNLNVSGHGIGNGGSGLSDKISPECFVETVVKYRLGGYGNEFLDFEYLNNQLQLQQQQVAN